MAPSPFSCAVRCLSPARPIPRAPDADRVAIQSLVQQILDLKAAAPTADVSKLEAEIDIAIESHGGLPGAFDEGIPPVTCTRFGLLSASAPTNAPNACIPWPLVTLQGASMPCRIP